MSAEIKIEEPEIILVSPGMKADMGACRPDHPDGPCQPMQRPCNPECAPACSPSSLPCRPQIPCYPDVGRPPTPPPPGPN